MNTRSLWLLPVALLALAGCGSTSDASSSEPAIEASAAEVAEPISTAETCDQIAPESGDGLLTDAIDFAQKATGDGDIDDELVTQARSLVDSYDPIIATAGDELRGELEMVADFPRGIVEAVDSGQSSIDLQPDDFKTGASVLVIKCMNDTATGQANEPTAEETSTVEESSLAAELKEQFPGYPVLVDSTTLDYRVAAAFERTGNTGQVVALVPGVYAPYNPNVPELDKYYEGGGVYGDSMMHKEYLPDLPGSFWSGVQPGAQEPQG